MNQPCFKEDDFVRWKPRWVAKLSDDTNVYQDDGRDGVTKSSAWDRLKYHCEQNDLKIKEFRLQFRSNIVPISLTGSQYLYFANSAYAFWRIEQTFHGYFTGIYRDGLATVTHYKTPELILLENMDFKIEENSRHLILTSP